MIVVEQIRDAPLSSGQHSQHPSYIHENDDEVLTTYLSPDVVRASSDAETNQFLS